ncbi:glutathionylspermidine synthase family protein [Adhaeribacter pallidiroseus]|uniref:Glutathionylspermidine amidase n=1 Tax=Adhaeribacter pallidiroseus TaxID=2072847 RepID=A0A369QJF2_9BACT|nr:glutathionylspermidine synthase family protein [Adhaeribacter pallidiroseus]RDC63356.1 Glutathionylspermidine amidase [Adhaeribacter pallidiroseus]
MANFLSESSYDGAADKSVRVITHQGNVNAVLQGLGWTWITEEGCANYLPGEAVLLPEKIADGLLNAATQLYDMMVAAVPENLPDAFLRVLDIPENLWPIIRLSWNDDRHWHIYGRFDLVQTAQGPKLLEFNADTATSIPETAVVQWASLAAAGKNDAAQASGLYEALVEQLSTWRTQNNDLAPNLVVTYIGESTEDRTNCEVMAQASREAGFEAYLFPIDALTFSTKGTERGVWGEVGKDEWLEFPFIFKLLPWEQIAWEEPELAEDLASLMLTRNVVVANPPYTLIWQSKGFLAWLWKAYPHHPLLLETSLEPIRGKYIRKPFFGREGQNVQVVDKQIIEEKEGEYGQQKVVYQAWVDLPQDDQGHFYQAGVFWAGEGCAIGLRREKGIITNLSQFLPHLLEVKR